MFKILFFVICLQHVLGQSPSGAGISSKLDFGESSTTDYESTLSTSLVKALVSLRQGSSKSLISSKLEDSPFNLRNAARNTQPKTDFQTLGVVCEDGKCNTTQRTDNLSTDIVVQVVTNLQKDNTTTKKTESVDEDVPVVVGYSGTNIKNSDFDLTNRRIDDNSEDVQVKIGTGGKNDHHVKNEVPYFNPNYNHHYFGEAPPPQFVWYRRSNQYPNPNSNPHMFRAINRPYKPWHWELKYAAPTITPPGWTTTTQCSCSNPGLKWYPSFGPNQPSPKPTVSDKMAPLN